MGELSKEPLTNKVSADTEGREDEVNRLQANGSELVVVTQVHDRVGSSNIAIPAGDTVGDSHHASWGNSTNNTLPRLSIGVRGIGSLVYRYGLEKTMQ